MGQRMRTRTDQGHLAPEDVQQLRQFVDTCRSQQPANGRYPRIVARGLHHSGPVFLHGHGAEFEHHELLAIKSLSELPENNRPGTVKLDGDAQ